MNVVRLVIYVLVTHAIIWFINRNPKLTAAALDVFRNAAARHVVPTIVLAEVFHVQGRGRITVSPAAVWAMIDSRTNAVVYPLDELVLERMPAGLEMHDSISVATALIHQATEPVRLVTDDARITASGLVDVLW